MKKIILSLLLVLPFLSWGQDRASQIRRQILSCDNTRVLVAAHRADWRNFPENSLEGIRSSIKMGVDIIEIDVQMTSDGHLVLMHDRTIDRTTSGKGRVSDFTLDSLRRLTLRNGCGIKTKYRIPTLEEALLEAKGHVMVNIDKGDAYFDLIHEICTRTGTLDHIIMKGSRPAAEVRSLLGERLSEVIYMPIVNLDKEDAREALTAFMDELQPAAFELLYADPSNPLPAEAAAMLAGRSLIWYNTLWDTLVGGHEDDRALEDPDGCYGYVIRELGASMIQTDRPVFLLEYLTAAGFR